MPIRYLTRKEIDESRWNDCIASAGNGAIYSYTCYLDAMADNWSGLVMDDYAAVMPLPWRKKWNVHYLYQPFLTAQLGLIGNNITAGLLKEFLQTIPAVFRYWDFPLNYTNCFDAPESGLYYRQNFVLPLRQSYPDLQTAYRTNIRRNVSRAQAVACQVKTDVEIREVAALSQFQSPQAQPNDLERFTRLFDELKQKERAKIYGVVSKAGELIASAGFLFSHNRWYYLLVGNHPNGRTLGASHMLIDAFIRDHAGQDMILDFEGSDLRNLAFFYSSFGAKEEPYAAINLNRLPWWARWMKK